MVKKGVKTPEYLLGFTMNVLSTPIALSLFIATVKIFQIFDDRAKRTMSR